MEGRLCRASTQLSASTHSCNSGGSRVIGTTSRRHISRSSSSVLRAGGSFSKRSAIARSTVMAGSPGTCAASPASRKISLVVPTRGKLGKPRAKMSRVRNSANPGRAASSLSSAGAAHSMARRTSNLRKNE